MGIFSGTAKGTSPMTTGGGKSSGGGTNQSPYKLADSAFSSKANEATRALAKKFAISKNTDRSLSKPVAGKSAIGAQ
jgi:hypothetical protein